MSPCLWKYLLSLRKQDELWPRIVAGPRLTIPGADQDKQPISNLGNRTQCLRELFNIRFVTLETERF